MGLYGDGDHLENAPHFSSEPLDFSSLSEFYVHGGRPWSSSNCEL